MSMWHELAELDNIRRATEESWLQECNEKGLEIFYDMSDAVERGVGCDSSCDDDCEEAHTILVGHYNTRPCKRPFHGRKGHVCNPRSTRITGLNTSGLGAMNF